MIYVRRSRQQGMVQRPEQNSWELLREGLISSSISWSDLYLAVKAVITRHILSCIPVRGQIPCKLTLKLIFFFILGSKQFVLHSLLAHVSSDIVGIAYTLVNIRTWRMHVSISQENSKHNNCVFIILGMMCLTI